MSYWVYLKDMSAAVCCSYGTPPEQFVPEYPSDEVCPEPCYPSVTVSPHGEGGTYVLGGNDAAELSITYNYGRFYYDHLGEDGLRSLHGQPARVCLPQLEAAVLALGTARSADYWAATPGNAGYALSILLGWAREHPEAVFRVS